VTLYETLNLIHVVAVIVWMGGSIMISVLLARTIANKDAAAVGGILGQGEFLGRFVFNPAGIVTLGAGIWMVIDGPWEFSEAWISIGFVGIAAGALLGALYYPRQFRAAGEALEGGAGLADTAVANPLNRLRMVASAETLLLLIVVWAMITKPGA
jgi:uncharacterized membrane protein